MLSTQIWIVMKQSTNLELNEPGFGVGMNVKNSHTLTTTTTGSKNSQKEANNQTSNQNSVLCPPKVPSLQALGLG